MFYLLSRKQKEKIQSEYWAKVTNLFTISLVVVFGISICVAVPTALKVYVEYSSLTQSVAPLENELSTMKVEVSKEGADKILSDFEILNMESKSGIDKIYQRFVNVVESVSGAKIQSMKVDTLSKTIQTTLSVRDKSVAQQLVDHLTAEKYVGAVLPYSVLSQKGSFMFAQTLNYQ